MELQVSKTLKGKEESTRSSGSLTEAGLEFLAAVYPISLDS